MKLVIVFFLSLFLFQQIQADKIDSLSIVVKILPNDSSKVNTLVEISKSYFYTDPDKTISYANTAEKLAAEINFPKGLALSYKWIGMGYYIQGKYIEALDNWEKSLAQFEKNKDLVGQANILNNFGTIYFDQTDETKALEYFLKSLKISEKINDSLRIATALCNIGNIYNNKEKRSSWDKGLDYYMRGLDLSTLIKDTNLIGNTTVGIGEIYFNKGDDKKAIEYFKKSLEANKGKDGYPYSLNALGKVYTKDKEYILALKYHTEAYQYAEKNDAKLDMLQSLLGMAKAYENENSFDDAINKYHAAVTLADTLGAKLELKDAYAGLAKSYKVKKDYTNAFKYQELLSTVKDTLYNISTDKKVASLQFDFDINKKQGQIDLMTKDKQLQELNLRRQKIIKNVTFAGLGIVLSFLVVVFFQKKRITKEKQRSEELLLNILPEETAEELKATGTAKAKSIDLVTVMFTDFKNFTQASELLSAEELVGEINECYSEFDKIITRYGIEKIKTIGDSYMCAGGLPVVNSTHPIDVIKAGLEMQAFITANKAKRQAKGEPFFELRLGIHTGPVVAGIVGIKKFAYDIWGDTVNTASRMESSGEVGKVNISGTTYKLVADKFICKHRGKIQAKNKGEIDMYFVEGIV